MRKIALTLFIIIGTLTASAESLLETFEKSLAAMGTYRVEFAVTIDDYTSSGSYVVSGDNFYAAVEGVEYYVADGVKHEVNSDNRQITIDTADSLGSDLLSNPSQGFATLARDFNVAEGHIGSLRSALLTPKQGGNDIITVVADSSGQLPSRIVYTFEGMKMIIELNSIKPLQGGLPRFDSSKYPNFEVVDMR